MLVFTAESFNNLFTVFKTDAIFFKKSKNYLVKEITILSLL